MAVLLAQLHPMVQRLALQHQMLAQEHGVPFIIVRAYCPTDEQDKIYAKGRSEAGEPCKHAGVTYPVGTCKLHPLGLIVTNARGGQSYHNYGLAYDVALVLQTANGKSVHWDVHKDANQNHVPDYEEVGALGKALGLEWGGEFKRLKDLPHFQYTFGLSIADLLTGRRPPPV